MKKKLMMVLFMAAAMVFGMTNAFALDYYVPEDATTATMRFSITDAENAGEEFSMTSESGELTIHVTNDTIIYFEDYVPVDDDTDEMTQMVHEVLFGRTLAEALDGRNMRVTFSEGEENVAISIMILFETAVHLPIEVTPVEIAEIEEDCCPTSDTEDTSVIEPDEATENVYEMSWTPLAPQPVSYEQAAINGEVVVNGEIIAGAPHPFWQEVAGGYVLMTPLRAVVEALDDGGELNWDDEMQSIRIGVATHLWIGSTEVHVGRMAPLELSTAPVLLDGTTFVPMDFFRVVLGKTAYLFEGQFVVESYSDMR